MIFVTGPLYAGKQEYVMKALHWSKADFSARAVRDAHLLAGETATMEEISALADRLCRKEVVIADEVGGGVVPVDAEERRRREAAGRLCCLLAERADTVIRVCMGIPQALKGELPK